MTPTASHCDAVSASIFPASLMAWAGMDSPSRRSRMCSSLRSGKSLSVDPLAFFSNRGMVPLSASCGAVGGGGAVLLVVPRGKPRRRVVVSEVIDTRPTVRRKGYGFFRVGNGWVPKPTLTPRSHWTLEILDLRPDRPIRHVGGIQRRGPPCRERNSGAGDTGAVKTEGRHLFRATNGFVDGGVEEPPVW